MKKTLIAPTLIAPILMALAAPVKAANHALECDTILNSPITARNGSLTGFSKYRFRVVVEFLGGGQVMWTTYSGPHATASSGRVAVSDSSYTIHLSYSDGGSDDITIDRQTGSLSSVSKAIPWMSQEGTCHPVAVAPKM